MSSFDRARPWARWAVPVACLLPLLGFWAYGLFDLDEGFYAAVVSEMMRRGEWITPLYAGSPWFEKPILAYWLTIPSVAVFGEAVGPRLPSVLCTLATVWALAWWACRWFGEAVAWLTALTYSGCLIVAGIGRMMMTDPPLVLCLVLAGILFFESCARPSGGVPHRLGAAFFLGLGVLAKGPVALVLFFVTVAVFSWAVPDWRRRIWTGSETGSFIGALFGRGAWLTGLAVTAATLAIWYVPCYLANGTQFIDDFLIKQNLGRFSGGDRAHGVPWWAHPIYYPAILALALVPGLVVAKRPFQSPPTTEPGGFAWRFAFASALVPLVFFTVSGTKLPHYILPAVPGLAVVIGVAAGRDVERLVPRLRWLLAWSVVLLALAHAVFTWDWNNRMREVQTLAVLARDRPEPLVLYQIGGRPREPEIGLKLQETSHPSVLFYYGRDLVKTDDPAELALRGSPYLVLTREASVLTDEFQQLGKIQALGGSKYRLVLIAPQ